MQDPQTGSFDAGRKILPTQWPARFPINQSSGSLALEGPGRQGRSYSSYKNIETRQSKKVGRG